MSLDFINLEVARPEEIFENRYELRLVNSGLVPHRLSFLQLGK